MTPNNADFSWLVLFLSFCSKCSGSATLKLLRATSRRWKFHVGCRVVLVGDPQQLPATVLSRQAQLANMERSMFERFQRAGCPVTMLSVQYRMHPSIRQFPSQHFYNNQLQDG